MAAQQVPQAFVNPDFYFIQSFSKEACQIFNKDPLSSAAMRTWDGICQWYKSFDETKVQALRDKVTQWAPTEPKTKEIREIALRAYGYMDHPDIDNRDKLFSDLFFSSVLVGEWATYVTTHQSAPAAREPKPDSKN